MATCECHLQSHVKLSYERTFSVGLLFFVLYNLKHNLLRSLTMQNKYTNQEAKLEIETRCDGKWFRINSDEWFRFHSICSNEMENEPRQAQVYLPSGPGYVYDNVLLFNRLKDKNERMWNRILVLLHTDDSFSTFWSNIVGIF